MRWLYLLFIASANCPGQVVAQYPLRLEADDYSVQNVMFRGDRLLTWGGNLIRSWDAENGRHIGVVVEDPRFIHTGGVCGDYFAYSSEADSTIDIVREDGSKRTHRLKSVDPHVLCISQKNIFGVRYKQRGVVLHELAADGIPKEVLTLTPSVEAVRGIIAPDGRWFCAVRHDRRILAWSIGRTIPDSSPVPTVINERDKALIGTVTSVTDFASDRSGSTLIVIGKDELSERGVIDIWNTDDWTYRRTLQIYERGFVDCVAFSPDGAYLAVGGNGVWPIDIQQPVAREERFAIKIYDTTSYEVVHTFRGHREQVTCLQFSSDGKLLASGSADKSAMIWKLQPTLKADVKSRR